MTPVSGAAEFEYPYFEPPPPLRDEDRASVRRANSQDAASSSHQLLPYTKEELEDLLTMLRVDPQSRRNVPDPYRCAHQSNQLQCRTRIADPTISRYCTEHRETVGEALHGDDYVASVADETRANLVRLVPKALSTTESVMDDEDAPAGVRLKAATEILDRTGYRAGVDLVVKGEVQVVDMTSIIAARLDAMGDSMRRVNEITAPAATPAPEDVVEGEIVED